MLVFQFQKVIGQLCTSAFTIFIAYSPWSNHGKTYLQSLSGGDRCGFFYNSYYEGPPGPCLVSHVSLGVFSTVVVRHNLTLVPFTREFYCQVWFMETNICSTNRPKHFKCETTFVRNLGIKQNAVLAPQSILQRSFLLLPAGERPKEKILVWSMGQTLNATRNFEIK